MSGIFAGCPSFSNTSRGWIYATGVAVLAALSLSVVSAHAGKKSYNNSWQQQQQEQQRQQQEELKRQQEQQRAEQARIQQEIQRQQQQMAERQRQMQQQLKQQQQAAQQRAAQEAARQQELRKAQQQAQQQQMLQQAQQRAAQEAARQQQMQRALEQQRQAQQQQQALQRAQQQQAAQRRAQQPQPDDDKNPNANVPPTNAAASAQDKDGASVVNPNLPRKHNDRSQRHHRPSQPNVALEVRPAPPPQMPAAGVKVPPVMRPPVRPVTSTAPSSAQPASPAPVGPAPAPGDGKPVEFAATQLTDAEIEKAKSLGFRPVSETVLPLSNTSVQQLRAPAGMTPEQARTLLLQQMPLGKFTVNHTYHIFKDQEGETDKRAPSACANAACMPAALINWSTSLRSCTKDVKIGIIDTSFDLSHPAFRELKVSSGQFLGGEQPSPYDWHGTAVLSLLAGDPRSGTPGLIPDAHFLLATAFKTDANGNASTDSIRLVAALEWMSKLDVKYVNMSFSGPRDPMVETVIQRMRREGVVFIAAAGNQGPVAPPSYPAAYPDVIAVTAVNRKGENYRHANRGAYIDVSAPGVDVLAALPDGRTGLRTGTSFAAPFVTAIVATQQASSMTTQAVWKPELLSHMALRDLGPPGPDPIYGQGLALAPMTCTGPAGSGTITAGTRPRPDLPPPMGAGMGIGDWGPAVINTSSGAAAE